MRIVIIGHGMVGARLVQEVRALDPHADRFDVLVLGAEPYAPYNRVLLSEVVAGRAELNGLTLPGTGGVHTLTGVAAAGIDRARRTVRDSRGTRHGYDVLVLATGAEATRPPVPGLGEHTGGVHVLRSLDDARAVVAAAANAGSAAVVGAGVLGVEVATGLAGRGLPTTLIGRGLLMDRHLDGPSSQALTTALAGAGVGVRHGQDLQAQVRGGRITAITVDGHRIGAGLLVLACGTTPRTRLAADAGLPVDRGVLVGPDLSSPADQAVFAIGDCAQPPGGATGLIAQGWDQARALARHLCGHPAPAPDADPDAAVVRVKAGPLVAAAMGRTGTRTPPGARRVSLSDPAAGRHLEVVLDQDRLVGAVCVGDAAVAADLAATFTRGTPLPADPAQLLVRPMGGGPEKADRAALTKLPDRTTICRCNGVSKGDIVGCWRSGLRTVAEVSARTRATTGCGTCTRTVQDLLDWVDDAEGGQPCSTPATSPARPRNTPSLP